MIVVDWMSYMSYLHWINHDHGKRRSAGMAAARCGAARRGQGRPGAAAAARGNITS
jgi:hypothetical protein